MKNKIEDVRNHMFQALERLNDDNLKGEELEAEIRRSQSIAEVGKVIVDSAKTEVMYMKLVGRNPEKATGFLDEGETKGFIERPKAEYSNNGHLKSIEKYA